MEGGVYYDEGPGKSYISVAKTVADASNSSFYRWCKGWFGLWLFMVGDIGIKVLV